MAEKTYTVGMYRLLHRFPEPSRHEVQTNRRIREALDAMGVPYDVPADNVTVARLEGLPGGKIVAIRADTDALQLNEETGLPFASEIPGMMHACGHDAHTACALACAKILAKARDSFKGTVKIIFQPAEEGEFGAEKVMRTGLVDDVNAFFGVHLWSPYKTGEMRVSARGVAASTDMFTLKIKGVGGHGAMPELCVDAIACASAVVTNLQMIVSRFTSPFSPVVVTVGSFHAGTRCNIIAGEAVLEGTIRTFDPEVYTKVHADFDRMVADLCHAYGCAYEFENRKACSVTYNDEALVRLALNNAREIAPEADVGEDTPSMLGDDFGEYRSIAPVCYMKVGIRNEAIHADFAHHHPRFRVDEDALPRAVAWLCMNAIGFLSD